MVSIHIFDEFQAPIETLSEESRHKKRIELEKLIFSTLKMKYGFFLKRFWESYCPPTNSSKQILILERRIHENLEFLLYNCAWAGQAGGWSITIVCSDINIEYVKSIVGEKPVDILPLFKGNPDPQTGKEEYNVLLQSCEFYEQFSAETLCTVEMDCYFRKPIPEIVTTCDYIASPYAWNHLRAGGGLSFRKRATMVEICKQKSEKYPCQDVYISDGIYDLGYSMPPMIYSKEICAESIFDCDPVGVHQWWTFFSTENAKSNDVFETFMTLEIPN